MNVFTILLNYVLINYSYKILGGSLATSCVNIYLLSYIFFSLAGCLGLWGVINPKNYEVFNVFIVGSNSNKLDNDLLIYFQENKILNEKMFFT